mgnify:CR=1 FL=1
MEQNVKCPNWMNHSPMVQFYQQVQAVGVELEPDPAFLENSRLGRYQEHQLKDLEMSYSIKDFLTKVGLPDQFRPFRLPSDEKSGKHVYLGTLFWVSCLRNEKINRKKYLVIGENRAFNPTVIVSERERSDGTIEKVWDYFKGEHVSYEIVELKTGSVWTWYHDSYGDDLSFVNSSLEQYLLSMAYWQSFYQDFSEKIGSYLKENKDKREWEYVEKNRKKLYAPFIECIKILDPPALRKRMTVWKRLTDISLI